MLDGDTFDLAMDAVIVALLALFTLPIVIAYYRRQNVLMTILLSLVFWPAAMTLVLRRSPAKPSDH